MPEEKTPDPKAIEETVGKLDKFVQYVVEVLRGKNWTTKILLLDVLLFAAFNPIFFPKLLELVGVKQLPNHYALYFWLVIGAVFIAAVVAAWRARPKEKPFRDLSESRAIKGLLPYTKDDAALFARLQREHDLTECLLAVSDPSFRFGVLSGESGAGKSSFLQAGLWAEFEKRKLRCVYVKFSDLDPFESVKRACLKHLSLPDGVADTSDFLTLLDAAARQDSSPIVLLFDQFEQFFVHRKRKKDREPFVQALARWFAGMQSSPVKILLCIRGDFLDRLNELQKAMRYSLSPAQSFRLERFEPDQATEVFCFLAEKESLEYDRKFIYEMTRQELSDTEDGLISPVDIQVLAWMIAGQPVEDGRAFNRTTFQKLGGVDGLLERYLTRALAVRETEARRQAAIKVLLALTDLERNTRAGALTLEALRQKLGGDINDAEMKEAIAWLARSDVRLVSPSSEGEEEKFELAHERLIPALRRLAGKELSEADRANQLLDRRANEWLGNGRHSRYLFSWSELRLVNRHRRFVTWGKERQAKEELLAASRRRFRLRYAAMGMAILLAVAGWNGWKSNAWQTYLIKRELRTYGNSLSDNRALIEIAQASVYAGDSQLALQVVERISDDRSKTDALRVMVWSYTKLGELMKDSALLAEAVKTAERISDDSYKPYTLRAIAESYAKLGDKGKASALLADAIETAERIRGERYNADALIAISWSYFKIGENEKARGLLSEALKTAKQRTYDAFQIGWSINLGETMKDSGLLSEALKTAEGIRNDSDKAYALIAIAESYLKIGEKKKAGGLLLEALKTAERTQNDSYKAGALRAIVWSIAKLGEKGGASGLLAEALKMAVWLGDDSEGDPATPVPDVAPGYLADYYSNASLTTPESYPSFKTDALRAIAESYIKLGEKEKAREILSEALKTAERIGGQGLKNNVLRKVAESYAKLGETMKDSGLFSEALKTAERIGEENTYVKADALRAIVGSIAKFGEKGKASELLLEALKTAERIRDGSDKAIVLSAIAASYAKLGETVKDSKLLSEGLKIAGRISDGDSKADALSAIAESYAKLSESVNDRTLYDKTFKLIEGLGADKSRDKILGSILTSKLAVADVGRLRSLAFHYDSGTQKAKALARILMAVSHPELIGKEKESEDDNDR